jgi:hypothetical protein
VEQADIVLFEIWKEYINHVKEIKEAIFWVYEQETFKRVPQFFIYASRVMLNMKEYILSALFLNELKSMYSLF